MLMSIVRVYKYVQCLSEFFCYTNYVPNIIRVELFCEYLMNTQASTMDVLDKNLAAATGARHPGISQLNNSALVPPFVSFTNKVYPD